MKKTKSKTSRVVVTKEREDNFRIGPSEGIPEYKAENDRYCPRAQVRKFNLDKKLKAKMAEDSLETTHNWIDNVLKSKHNAVPVKLRPTLRAQAVGALNNKESLAEVEILQKIIVRENLLNELGKLLKNQTDIYSCLGEVVELVKALRFQTVDIIEDIEAWQCVQHQPRAFLYRGANYAIKILHDLDFLDSYEEVVERFCFEFTGNPLGYRGGGDLLSLPSSFKRTNANTTKGKASSYLTSEKGSIDGVEVIRLHNAEKFIQKEIDRVEQEKAQIAQYESMPSYGSADDRTLYQPYPPLNQKELGEPSQSSTLTPAASLMSPAASVTVINASTVIKTKKHNKQKSSPHLQSLDSLLAMTPGAGGESKSKLKFNPKKVKLERIRSLNEEVNELQAMEAHIEDQIQVLVDKHRGLAEQRRVLDAKRQDAVQFGRDAAAQHYAVEISVLVSEMQEINLKIKDLQRQEYFITLEKKRKALISQKISQEIKEEQRKAELAYQIKSRIKEGGLLAALKTLNKVSMDQFKSSIVMPTDSASSTSPKQRHVITESDILNTMDQLSPNKGRSGKGVKEVKDVYFDGPPHQEPSSTWGNRSDDQAYGHAAEQEQLGDTEDKLHDQQFDQGGNYVFSQSYFDEAGDDDQHDLRGDNTAADDDPEADFADGEDNYWTHKYALQGDANAAGQSRDDVEDEIERRLRQLYGGDDEGNEGDEGEGAERMHYGDGDEVARGDDLYVSDHADEESYVSSVEKNIGFESAANDLASYERSPADEDIEAAADVAVGTGFFLARSRRQQTNPASGSQSSSANDAETD